MIDYTLTRSNRKTIAIHVTDRGVEVRAPLKASKYDINKFVASKEKWIRDKLAQSNERLEQREKFSLTYGSSILYRGKNCLISAKPGNMVSFADEQFYMPPDLSPEQVMRACVQIYRLLAKRDLTHKVLDFAKQMSVMPIAVKINGAKARWGSCSGKKSINFSWRLIMAEDDVIDYVVVHELAHITEMNHSVSFWAIVQNVLPDYRDRKKRLEELQKKLSVEDWE
ncbi:MAG: M48 family metallopeptidase [Oscillospiraceae bacterium]|jgi:predicted metal-dependent hydrolase|nr:M48 family metallopeptidase [Oscillospiraceae bacterium]